MDLELIRDFANDLIQKYKQSTSLDDLKITCILGCHEIQQGLKENFNNPLASFTYLPKDKILFFNKLLKRQMNEANHENKQQVLYRTLTLWRFLYDSSCYKDHRITLIIKNKTYNLKTLNSLLKYVIEEHITNGHPISILFIDDFTYHNEKLRYLNVLYTTDDLLDCWKPLATNL